MTEDVGIQQVDTIYRQGYEHIALEVLVAALVQVVDAASRIVWILFQGGVAVVADAQIFVFKHLHLGIIGVYQIAHHPQGAIEDGKLPRLTIIYLSASGYQGKQHSLGRVVGLEGGDVGDGRRAHIHLLAMNRDGCHKENQKYEQTSIHGRLSGGGLLVFEQLDDAFEVFVVIEMDGHRTFTAA